MANEAQLVTLLLGVSAWNAWRQQCLEELIDLSRADLSRVNLRRANLSGANLSRANLSTANLTGADLTGADLRGASLRRANLSEANLMGADLRRANLKSANLSTANLTGAKLRGHDLSEANLSGAHLSTANLSGADLSGATFRRADLSEANLTGATFRRADLSEANLTGATLMGANLTGANLSRADLSGAALSGHDLREVNLSGANLRRANLSEANLSGANLSGANLSGAHLNETSLIDAILNGTTLTDAYLWETQRGGWSIQGIVCEAVHWDRDNEERTPYSPGEFERLYAHHTKIVLYYEGGISPIEVATLPVLIQRMEATHAGCVLRLDSVQNAAGGATVTLVVEGGGRQTPADLQETLQEQAKQLQAMQRYALEQADMRQGIEYQLSQLKDAVFPLLLADKLQERALQAPSQTYYLTTLFLDMKGFSRLGEEQRKEHMSMLRGLAQPLLAQGSAQYINTWGDAIVACFENTNAGLTCAWQLVRVLHAAGIQTRIGMSYGKTSVRGNSLIGRLDIDGESVNWAARLEPLAELGEVLIAEELRYHPQVEQKCFIFTRHQRMLKKAVGDQKEGEMVECYSVQFVEESQK